MEIENKKEKTFGFLLSRKHFRVIHASLISQHGSLKKPMLLFLGMLVIVFVIGTIWVRNSNIDKNAKERPEPVSLSETKDPVTGDRRYTFSIPTDRQEAEEAQDLWGSLEEVFRVERVNPSGDPRQNERALAKRNFHELKRVIKELEEQGLEGEDLYTLAENRLIEASAEGALQLLEGYRQLEGALEAADLDSMSPEERFEYVVKARRDAFGEEVADYLFFEKEAYTQYQLEEQAIQEDTGLTQEEQQAEINSRRNALQMELASRGSYVSFADERRRELDQRLRDRYGESLESMSDEERTAAIWDLYREESPPEMIEKAERIMAVQAQRKAAFEAYREESEAILNNEELNFDEKQKRLSELSAQYNAER